MPVKITYVVVEGTTDTEKDIQEMVTKIKSSLQSQFSPREVIITISEPLDGDDPMESELSASISGLPVNRDTPPGYT
jgi:hypothetical protein